MLMNWTKREHQILSRMEIAFDYKAEMSNNQIEDLYDIVPDYMMENTDTSDDHPNSDFNICEDIITKLAKALEEKGLLAWQNVWGLNGSK